ncbi:zinc finger and BTB domain-containing protein 41-like [Tigriopus californicus]|uniref:zinc finger and BTB domain-containing protein 41-like n=1 Tax=Tigriopus californicus TaxID=6832 RepID=UPI0027DA206C|nr:zinc finger and BTB domain-containing protein 41-like [Tigriopus californicus]
MDVMASVEDIQPFQHLCNLLKSIEKDSGGGETVNMEQFTEGSHDASKLVVGLSKLIQLRQEALKLKKDNQGDISLGQDCEVKGGDKTDQKSESDTKEDMSKYLDRDYSCFFCRTKCYTKEKFFSHFRSHFSSPEKLTASKSSPQVSDPEDSDPSSVTGHHHHSQQQHPPTLLHQHNHHRSVLKRRRKIRRKGIRCTSDDIDSGCHSVESSSSYSSDMAESDCFLGDSESSDSDENDENRLERKRRRMMMMMGLEAKSTSLSSSSSTSSSSSSSSASSSSSLCSPSPSLPPSSSSPLLQPHHHHHHHHHLMSTNKKTLFQRRSSSSSISSSHVSKHDRLSLAEKQLDNNETEGLICLTCLKRFSNCQNLRRHLRLHIARDSITPDIDRGIPEDEDNLEGKYICDWCPAKFDNRSAARIHETSHKGDDFKCYVCEKLYADRYSLRYHLRTHGIGRQIRCEYCNKSFSKPSRLEAHVKSHHNNIRDFKCSECDKAFKTAIHLKNHFRQHSGERPFVCSVCHMSFRHKASLLTHMRSHDGARPFCCEICGKTFREPSTLKAHRRVHTGDKPYKCNLCDKTFTQRAGLNYHKQMHAGVKPFKCQVCGYTTAKGTSLANHYRNIHQLQDHPPIVKDPNAMMVVPEHPQTTKDIPSESSGMSCSIAFASDKRSQRLEIDGTEPSLSSLQHQPQLDGTGTSSLHSADSTTTNTTSTTTNAASVQQHLADENSKSQQQLSATPLPSPPVQSGDAIFREKMEVTVPGTVESTTPSMGNNMTPSQTTVLPSFDHLRQGSPAHIRYNMPSPGASSICSVGSSTLDASSSSSCFINGGGAYQQSGETPPLTPPSNVNHEQDTTDSMDDLLPSIGDTDFLPTLNISELTNHLAFTENHQPLASQPHHTHHSSNGYTQGGYTNSEELWQPRTHQSHLYHQTQQQYNQLYFNQIHQQQQHHHHQPQQQQHIHQQQHHHQAHHHHHHQQQQQQHQNYNYSNFNCCSYYGTSSNAESHHFATNANGTTTSDLSQMTASNSPSTSQPFSSQTAAVGAGGGTMSNGNSNPGGVASNGNNANYAENSGSGVYPMHAAQGGMSLVMAISNGPTSADQGQSTTGYCI